MGGRGSGNRQPRFKKLTVEESIDVAIRDFQQAIHSRSAEGFTVAWESGFYEHSIGLFLNWGYAGPTVTLEYRFDDDEDVSIPIHLEATPTNFDGERWWWTCPLIVGGVPCNRRVGKLYLPPGARYFGCRVCHELTYLSCQMTRARRCGRLPA